ncbi:hypothetical protein K470DRAFT_251625 [Piedraia hortae CBS 480.64]|uniref:Formin GTPase-binding domain-containing protein n=1 Tax=Piedraia hortae CBS 480.64 TaxID=1314780 RepID=A0A6A7BT33_9PEZI|nr:hypothetical protein K470DRAFT_251625 [Piedraia hortae CBS 480.64]
MDPSEKTPRGRHRRHPSSRGGNILRSLVSSKSRPSSPEGARPATRTKSVPLLPPDHPHAAMMSSHVLGELHDNARDLPPSPTKSPRKRLPQQQAPRKSKSSANLGAMFARINRSSKDFSSKEQGKENTQPEGSDWESRRSQDAVLANEMRKYTPSDGQQRNFGSMDPPTLRPMLKKRPKSACLPGNEIAELRAKMREDGKRDDGSSSISSREQKRKSKFTLTRGRTGGKVMAAVAALQGKMNEPPAEPKDVDAAFEAVLDARNIPEAQRQKMRSLTKEIKQDFINKNQARDAANSCAIEDTGDEDDVQPVGKRSRTRSRTFTFSKEKTSSPIKKQRRPVSMHREYTTPVDYISYLKLHQDPTAIEVGRVHKLRLLLRNETVTWVDTFIDLGGMSEIISLLHRIMAIEWREEHEDRLLHETLRCLKGVCTTERAMIELDTVADDIFSALLAMLFDEEKKGPAEYATRAVIINVLFNFLENAVKSSPDILSARANRILKYLSLPATNPDKVDFVMKMHVPRPYKRWCQEVTNVTKEVFWIFLHHHNTIALPRVALDPAAEGAGGVAEAAGLTTTISPPPFSANYFPKERPPVPAAPYTGGVEWDATTYLTTHLDLLNGLIASLPTIEERNNLRNDLKTSGFEKVMGGTLRTCKEKFYGGVHDALRLYVAAAVPDGWETKSVREGYPVEGRGKGRGREEPPPRLDLDLGGGLGV